MTERPVEYATLTADDLLTGEAVALDLPPASIGLRIGSGLIDMVATLVAAVAIIFLFVGAAANTDGALLWASTIAAMVVVFVLAPATVETLTRGKSLGKLAFGLRTVRDDAGPIAFGHAFVRALVGYVEIYAFSGVPAFFSALLSQRGKRLGDHAAGTYVIRDRFSLQLPAPVPMPEQLRGWASGADMTPLPANLALAVRQYLGRLHQITPQSRAELGARLAQQVMVHVSPAPPPGTAPEYFLAAVIAARRERDLARLAREADLHRRLTRAAGPHR